MKSAAVIAAADRQYDKDESREPGCHARPRTFNRNRFRFLVGWVCTGCGCSDRCECPKEGE